VLVCIASDILSFGFGRDYLSRDRVILLPNADKFLFHHFANSLIFGKSKYKLNSSFFSILPSRKSLRPKAYYARCAGVIGFGFVYLILFSYL
jgi:hypothetical protein